MVEELHVHVDGLTVSGHALKSKKDQSAIIWQIILGDGPSKYLLRLSMPCGSGLSHPTTFIFFQYL